jgi:hypothetical protein
MYQEMVLNFYLVTRNMMFLSLLLRCAYIKECDEMKCVDTREQEQVRPNKEVTLRPLAPAQAGCAFGAGTNCILCTGSCQTLARHKIDLCDPARISVVFAWTTFASRWLQV